MVRRLFSKFEKSKMGEARFLIPIRIDTTITIAVDALRYTTKETEILPQNRDHKDDNEDKSLNTNGNIFKKTIASKGVMISQESTERLGNILLLYRLELSNFFQQSFASAA